MSVFAKASSRVKAPSQGALIFKLAMRLLDVGIFLMHGCARLLCKYVPVFEVADAIKAALVRFYFLSGLLGD